MACPANFDLIASKWAKLEKETCFLYIDGEEFGYDGKISIPPFKPDVTRQE